MANPDRENIEWDTLAVGATRPPVLKGFNVPNVAMLPIVGIPVILTIITLNPAWLLLVFLLTVAARVLVGHDHNHPRILWLAFATGTLIRWKGPLGRHSVDPHLDVRVPLHERFL